MQKPKACIIGAGSSGLPAIKALRDVGIEVDCFEIGSQIGGNWVFGNDNGISNIYRSLHINTSRTRMEYADYAMPDDYPDYPGHEKIASYFEAYTDHFDLKRHIEFNTEVTHCQRHGDGTWEVELNGDETRVYDALLVANGHHWDAKFPDPPLPGKFHGQIFHSHDYVDPQDPIDLFNKRVAILGIGNSAADIATEISRPGITEKTFLSARRGAWIVPNYFFGKPMDIIPTMNPLLHPVVPWSVRKSFFDKFVRVAVGDMTQYGLPEPEHEFTEAHPTISSELPVKVGRGDVTWAGNIKQLKGNQIEFDEAGRQDIDVLIYCTGYNVSFPFFDKGFIAAENNDLPLFKRVFKPDIPNLFFIGLCQPLGAIMPIAEEQSKWVANYLTGNYALPTTDHMKQAMKKDRSAMFNRYIGSPRHTMQVDFDDYLWDIQKEQKRGAKRASREQDNHWLPVKPIANKISQLIKTAENNLA